MIDQPPDGQSNETGHLSVVQRGEVTEVVDAGLGSWIVRFEPMAESSVRGGAGHATASGVAAGLVGALPGLRELARDRGAMRIVFSPEVRNGLATGTMRLMGGTRPVAVDQVGKIVGMATVTGAGTAGLGAVGVGAVAATWPVVLGAGVATAAAIAQQRWLERTFAGLSEQLDRIEARLRDDDLGTLDAADGLVELLAGLGYEELPHQLREELAVARRLVDGIYFSRRRFVERLKRAMEAEQIAHEAKTGERRAWVGDIAKQLSDGAAIDELIVFVRAMVGRARLGALTAGLLAAEGAPMASLSLVDKIQATLRSDYWDLQNRLSALAQSTPESLPAWRRFIDRADVAAALERSRALSEALTDAVGRQLPDADEPLVLDVPAGWAA